MESLIYFLLVAAMFVIMMRFGCGAHVMGHGHRHESHDSGGRRSPPPQVKDPVCGMEVETASAKATIYEDTAYYFCSAACRDKFEASPRTYVSGNPALTQSKEIQHGAHH